MQIISKGIQIISNKFLVYTGKKILPAAGKRIKTPKISLGGEKVNLKFISKKGETLEHSPLITFKEKSQIRPENLYGKTEYCTRYIDYPAKPQGKYINICEGKSGHIGYKDSLNPETLRPIEIHEPTMSVNNFVRPCGTIAISSDLNKPIITDGLLQCAAVSIVDKKQNLQVLIHCCPMVEAKENRAILDYIMAIFKKSTPEITIVPGVYKETDSTISFLVDNIKDITKGKCNIKFAQLPADEQMGIIALKNGEIGYTKTRPAEIDTNPDDKIIFCNSLYKRINGQMTFIRSKRPYFA